MTRKRDRRSSPPSFGSRNPPPASAAPRKGQGAEAKQPLARPAPRDRTGERREAKVSLIYGFHSVGAALKAPRRELIRLYATAAAAERLSGEIAARGLETRIMAPEEISARAPRDAVHQGLLLEARPLAPIDIADLPANGLVLVLDQITDPHNVGAILRTGAAFAVDALVTTERHSPEFAGDAGEVGFRRARACADLQRHQSGAGARRDGGHGLLADRARFGGVGPAYK